MHIQYKNNEQGFSLIELIIAFSLIGCLAMISLNSLQDMIPEARVNRAVREIASLLEWARWNAVRHSAVFKVVFDAEPARLIVYKETKDSEGEIFEEEVRRLKLQDNFPGIGFGTARGVQRTSGCKSVQPSGLHLLDDNLKFRATGTSDRCGSIYLVPAVDLPDRKDRMRAISILLAAGRVQIWNYDPFKESKCKGKGTWSPQ